MRISPPHLSRGQTFGLLASLYFAQGLPFGFFNKALPVLLRQQDVSLEAIGVSGLLFLPWALKLLWAPLLERHYDPKIGKRRSWILPLQWGNALLLLIMALWSPSLGFSVLMIAIFLVNLLSATQDIASDGLAITLLKPEDRGPGNSIQVGAYRIGMILGGGALLMALEEIGWVWSFTLMSAMMLLSTIPIWRFKEVPNSTETTAPTKKPTPEPTNTKAEAKTETKAEAKTETKAETKTDVTPGWLELLKGFVARDGAKAAFLLLIAYKMGDAFAGGMVKPFLVDQGLSMGEVGEISGFAGSIAGLLGALIGGLLIRPLGRRNALAIFAILQTLTYVAFAYSTQLDLGWWDYVSLISAEHLASGMGTVVLFTCMMDWCREATAGLDYTLLATIVVVVTGVGGVLSGISAGALGHTNHFILGAVFCSLAILSSVVLYPHASKLASETLQ